MARTENRPAMVITDEDAQPIGWLARFGYATTPVLCQRFQAPYHTMRWRISRLTAWGLLREERCHRPWLVIPTADGLGLAGDPLSVPSFSIVRVRHTLGIAELGCEAEFAGSRVWAEREIRVADRGRRRLTLSVHLPWKDNTGRPAWHVSDLVIAHPAPSGGAPLLEAVELELTAKSGLRLRHILSAYAASPLFSRVTYYTPSRRLTVAIEDAAASISLRARQLVKVRPYSGGDYGTVDLTRGVTDILDARAAMWTPHG